MCPWRGQRRPDSQFSDYLKLYNLQGDTVPSDATIVGVEHRWQVTSTAGTVVTYDVQQIVTGIITGAMFEGLESGRTRRRN